MFKFFLSLLLLFSCALAQDTISNFNIVDINGSKYVDGAVFAGKLSLDVRFEVSSQRLQVGNSFWVPLSPFVAVSDSVVLLKSPALLHGGSFFLPFPQVVDVLQKATGKLFSLDSASGRIVVMPLKDLWSVGLEAREGGEILELKLSRAFKVENFFHAQNYLLRINGASIDSLLFADLAKKSSLISRVIPVQDKQSAQVTLVVNGGCEGVELIPKDEGRTLQVVLRKKKPAAKPAAAQSQASTVKPAAGGRKIKTIVIDPGHGGKDPGAIGHRGLQEKSVVLDVALKLKSKLESKGFVVKLTRSSDVFIDLSDRPKLANNWDGDLFLSLHCNAIAGKVKQLKTDGFAFYVLRESNSEEDRAIARRENQAIELESGKKGKNEISPVEWIVLENQLNLYARESERLAGHLVEAFDGGSIRKEKSGARQAGFMVLVGAYMPTVLAELGYITSPKDGEILASERGRGEIADRLSKAVVSFAK